MHDSTPEPLLDAGTRGSSILDDLVAELLAAHEGAGATALAQALEDLCLRHPAQARSLRRRFQLLAEMGMLDDDPADAPPRKIPDHLGEFQLAERLGQGGMGVVYRARQPSLEREVALKLVRPEQLWFDGARERFRREVTTVARLSHPGIVPVFAVGEEDGLPWFAMELVRGVTVAEVLGELQGREPASLTGADFLGAIRGRMGLEPHDEEAKGDVPEHFQGSWPTACLRIVRAVAEALEHAHRLGILHRDLKPSNIMLTPEGRVLLVDFGLSSEEGGSQASRTASSHGGSLPYMAPELLEGEGRPARTSDVYALGVTLYELLSLRLPYAANSSRALRAKVVEANPQDLRGINPKVSWETDTVCRCAMERASSARYATAADLALDLSNVLEQRPIVARRPGPARRLRRLIEAHPVFTVALLVLAVAGPTTWGVQEARANRLLAKKQVEIEEKSAALGRTNADLGRAVEESRVSLKLAISAVDESLSKLAERQLMDVPGLDKVRRELLSRAVELHETVAARHPDLDLPTAVLAAAYFREANAFARDGDFELAIAGYRTQIRLTEGLIARGRTAPEGLDPFPHCLNLAAAELGDVLNRLGRRDEAIEVHGVALKRCERLLEDNPELLYARMDRATALTRTSQALAARGDYDEALPFALDAIDALEPLIEDMADDVGPWQKLANTYWLLGIIHGNGDRLDDAQEALDNGLAVNDAYKARFPGNTTARMLETRLWNQYATLISNRDGIGAAVEIFAENLERIESLAADFPRHVNVVDMVITGLMDLGIAYVHSGEPEHGHEHLERAAAELASLIRRFPDTDEYVARAAVVDVVKAEGWRQRGEAQRATQLLERALPQLEATLERSPGKVELADVLIDGYLTQADLALAAGDAAQAAAACDAGLACDGLDTGELLHYARRLSRCARLARDAGYDERALDLLRRAAERPDFHPSSLEAEEFAELESAPAFQELLR